MKLRVWRRRFQNDCDDTNDTKVPSGKCNYVMHVIIR